MVEGKENHFIRVIFGLSLGNRYLEIEYILYRESSRGKAKDKIKELKRNPDIYVGIETLISKTAFNYARGNDIIKL